MLQGWLSGFRRASLGDMNNTVEPFPFRHSSNRSRGMSFYVVSHLSDCGLRIRCLSNKGQRAKHACWKGGKSRVGIYGIRSVLT